MTKRSLRRIPVTTLADGNEAALVLHELHGNDGPTVGLCAAIHGNEPTGTEIILEVNRQLADTSIAGTLLLLPVANPAAFAANRRHTPLDDQNMNRVFPGNPGGWVTEQLAAVMSREFLERVDVLIDLHAGGDKPTVDYVYLRNDEALSRSFGSRVLYRAAPGKAGTMFAGTSVSVTDARNVPSATIELGGGRVDQRPYVERGVRGVVNMLRHLQVVEGEVDPPPEQIVVDSITTIRPRAGGFLENLAPPLGSPIALGDPLGRVVSPYTFEILEEIENPVPNGVMILAHLTRNVIEPGDYGYMVGSVGE